MYKIIIGVVIAAAVVIIGFMMIDPKVNTNGTSSNTTETNADNGKAYTIEGEVNKPGTYLLSEGISMQDLITAGGGLTNNADDLAFFYEATLKSGSTYYIASKFDNTDICNNQEITKVNINSDTADALTSVNGITSSIASSIVSYRTSNGAFKTLEQIMEVYGVGNATYRKVRNYITLHA